MIQTSFSKNSQAHAWGWNSEIYNMVIDIWPGEDCGSDRELWVIKIHTEKYRLLEVLGIVN